MFFFNRLDILSSRSSVWSAVKNPVFKGKNMKQSVRSSSIQQKDNYDVFAPKSIKVID
jgi:hypothetical protein